MAEAQNTVLTLSLKEYKKQIDDLRAQLAQLEKGSEEYRNTAQKVRDMQNSLNDAMKVGKEANEAAKGSYNDLQQQLSTLRKEWKATNDEAKRDELGKQMESLNNQLKELDGSIGNFQRNVGNYEGAVTNMKASMKEWIMEMAELDVQGKGNSERYLELAQKVGLYKDAMADAQAVAGQYADDTKALSAAIDVAKTGAAVFGLWQGAMSAFGVESESATKAIQKLQAVMVILNSLQTIQTALTDKASKTYQALAAVYNFLFGAKTKNVTASKAMTAAMTAETVATEGATVATNMFKKALISTGIGAVVVLIGTLVAHLTDLKSLFGSSADSAEDFADKMKAVNEEVDNFNSIQQKIIQQKLDFGEITKTEAAQQNIEAANSKLEAMINNLEELASKFYDLSNKGDFGGVFAGMTSSLEDFSFALRHNTKDLEGQRETYNANASTYAKLPALLKDIEKALDDDEYATKRFGKTTKEQLSNAWNYVNGLMTAYNSLGVAIDASAAKSEQDRKDEEDEKKRKADEAKRKRDEAARKATERLKKAQDDENKAVEENIKKLKRDNEAIKSQITFEDKLRKAKGLVVDEFENELKVLNQEIKGFEMEKTYYIEQSKNMKLSAENRKKYSELAADKQIQIDNAKNQIIIINAEKTSKKVSDIYKNSMAVSETKNRMFTEALNKQLNMAKLGIGIGDWPEKVKKQTEDVVKEIVKNFSETGKKFGLGDTFSVMTEDGKIKLDKIQEVFKKAKEVYGDGFDDFYGEVSGDMEILKEHFAERTAQNYYLEQVKALDESLKSTMEALKVHKNASEFFNDMMNKATELMDNGQKKEADEILSTLDIVKKKYPEFENLANLIMEQKEKEADFLIAQQERISKRDSEAVREHKDNIEKRINATMTFVNSMGDLMGAVADIEEANIDKKVKNGEISEEQAEQEFERVKKLQSAQLWINTIAGAAGAFMQDMKSYPSPWNYAIAAADMATAFATGIAQQKQINAMQYGSTSSGSMSATNSISSINVSNLLNERVDSNSMTAFNTGNMANGQKDSRVYILQSDITKSNTQVAVRQKSTTF